MSINLEELTDEDLVKHIIEDIDSFSILIDRYEQRLTRYIKRLFFLNEQDVEDVLQNVFIKAYINIHSFSGNYKFSSWIYRIAHNETINFYKKLKNKSSSHLADLDIDSKALQNIIHEDLNPEDGYIDQIFSLDISKILNSMDGKYKDILILRFLEEMDYIEIADVLRISVGSVGSLINRAKKQLNNLLLKINHEKTLK
jgi:RNA polymerase sigma-70 factor, ECF subfamily